MTDFATQLQTRIQPYRAQLAAHPLYSSMETLEDLQVFLASHVFAVWDFMSLLKALQRGLTCVELPWLPTVDAESCRFINEIVLGEESDSVDGRVFSHFELYLEAMRECGADCAPVERFVAMLRRGSKVREALVAARTPVAAADFVRSTFSVIDTGSLPAIASAFTFGREDLIPEMFRGFVRGLNASMPGQVSTFLFYLERHIEVDGDDHGPLALRLIAQLCGEDEAKWNQATEAAESALKARLALWDDIYAKVVNLRYATISETVTI
jgi:hypothetical protein